MRGQTQIRYSEAFKLQVIRELETGELDNQQEARRKYGIGGGSTVHNWLRRYGKRHLLSKVIRVEKPEERDQMKALERRIKELEKALVDSKVQEVLHKAYFEIMCERCGVEDVESVKKKAVAKLSGEPSKEDAEGRG